MYIELEKLILNEQYIDNPIMYYFDRKKYDIILVDYLPTVDEEPFERYIPLFQIDRDRIEDDFIRQLNNRILWRDYDCHREGGLEAFLQKWGMVDRWWRYYSERIEEIAIDWCEKNRIRYKRRED